MNDTWKYGQYDLDKDALLKYLQSNADSYMKYNDYDDTQKNQFLQSLNDISNGIREDSIVGDGFKNFTDNTGQLQSNDMTNKAFGFVHTVANAMGKKFGSKKKKEEEKKEEEVPEQETFDYNKHGLGYGFNKKYNPFGTDNTYNLWKSGFNTQEELNNSLLDYIGQHRTDIQNSNYDFSKSQIDKDRYLSMLNDLENDIRTDGIQDSDKSKLKFFGLDPSAFIVAPKEEKQSFQGEGNKTGDPFGHVEWQTGLSEEEQKVQNQKEAEKIAQMPVSEYIDQDWTESDKLRLKALGLDVLSIVDPEPVSASGLGFYSDYLNQRADELEGGSFGWDDAANYAISAVGAIPILGDAAKGANLIRKMGKLTTKLMPVIGAVVTGQAIENGDEIIASAQNILINHDFSKVEDWRNLSTALQLVMGGYGSYRNIKGRKQANNLTDQAEEALVVQLKNNGKTENYQFSGKDKEDLLALKDKPEEFNKYIRENFEGLGKVEAAKINTEKGDLDWKNREHWYSKPKRKEGTKTVVTENKPVYEKGQIPGKWNRARYFLDNTDEAIKPTRKQVETPKADKQETKQEIKQETPKTEEAATQTNIPSEQNKVEVQKQESPKEQPKTTAEEPAKTEEKSDFSKTKEAASEKKQESVKATEIKPDIQSKAIESVNTKSEVSKFNASNIRKEFDKLKGKGKKKAKWALKKAKQDKELADLVKQDPSLASKEFNEMLAALQKADKKTTYEQAFRMLTESGYYKEGGVIKAQNGSPLKTLIPEWFNYKQKALTGWHRDLRKDRWTTEGVGFHTDADSLQSVYDANTNYTSDINAIGNDIQNYYNQSNYSTTTDLVNAYNKDATSINDFWARDHKYNEDTGEHAPTFKRLFASRSAGKDGILNYNLGYQDNLENVMGSTMWHRRMDWYEKPFDQLSDLEKQDRIHAIKLGNGSYGYVYKNHDGTIGELDNKEAERILNLEKSVEKSVDDIESVWDPETQSYVLPEVEVTAPRIKKDGQNFTGDTNNNDKKVEVPAPEKPNNSFFTTDKVLAAVNYFRAIGHNKKQLDLANRMVPLLYDPVEHHRSVYGNLRAIVEGNRQAAEIMSQASRPLTSDGSLQTAAQQDAYNRARQYVMQGWQSDDETMRKMSELAWQQEKENKENRYNIAMKNRENMHQVSKEKLMALMTKERSDYESLTNHINEWRTWIAADQAAKDKKANLLYSRQLNSYIYNNPDKYIQGWGEYHQDIWDRYNSGKTLSTEEQEVMSQIQSRLADAYYNEIYGTGDYYGYGINKPNWNPIFKSGGKLTKDQVKVIIDFLKESNKNYNKAIDRSVKGLYNHIKLQRKK